MRQKFESTHDTFLREVETFLGETGMPPSRFGKLAVNDAKFVTSLRGGADVRTGTMDRVRKFMRDFEGNGHGGGVDLRAAGARRLSA